MNNFSDLIIISREVKSALTSNRPVVAFESAVITHGLPYPTNLELALEMEMIAENHHVVPATIALINGKIHVGLSKSQITELSQNNKTHKISTKDLAIAVSNQWYGGTTVAATLVIAQLVGISVFATGGIGGVHRNSNFDISNDLLELSRNPVITVCAGAKSILDLPATLEYLETMGVPLLGFQTDEFPAFYSRTSGLKVTHKVETTSEIVDVFKHQKSLKLQNAILVVNPIPKESEIEKSIVENYIQNAIKDAENEGIHGPEATPYLLEKVAINSSGVTISANLALLKNNAHLACEISTEIASRFISKKRII